MHSGFQWTVAVGAGGFSPVIDIRGMPYISINGTSSIATVLTIYVTEDGTNYVATDKATASGTAHHLYATLGAKAIKVHSNAAVTPTIVIGANG